MGASWRILVSVLTVPFPREASSRMWGYEVFFPLAQLVLAAPLFILVMASQQKRSSRELWALSLLLSRSSGTAPSCSWAKPLIFLDGMAYLSISRSAGSGLSSCVYFRLPKMSIGTVMKISELLKAVFAFLCSLLLRDSLSSRQIGGVIIAGIADSQFWYLLKISWYSSACSYSQF